MWPTPSPAHQLTFNLSTAYTTAKQTRGYTGNRNLSSLWGRVMNIVSQMARASSMPQECLSGTGSTTLCDSSVSRRGCGATHAQSCSTWTPIPSPPAGVAPHHPSAHHTTPQHTTPPLSTPHHPSAHHTTPQHTTPSLSTPHHCIPYTPPLVSNLHHGQGWGRQGQRK